MKRLVGIIIIMILFVSCSYNSTNSNSSNYREDVSTSSIQDTDSSSQTLENSSVSLNYFGILSSGIGTGAPVKNGFYYVQEQESSYANIMYIDYETGTYFPLCARPECKHNDDTCTSYLGWRGGYPQLLANSKNLIMMTNNAGAEYFDAYKEEALSSIQISNLNGENRKTLALLHANEEIQTQAACDNQYVYFIKKTVDELTVTTSLCSASLISGEINELYRLPVGTSFLMGAEGRYVIIKCYSQPQEGVLYSDDDTQIFFCVNVDTGNCVYQKELPFSIGDSAVQTLINGSTLYLYSPHENSLILEDLKTGVVTNRIENFFEAPPSNGQIVTLLNNRLIFSEHFKSQSSIDCIWYDLETNKRGTCNLKGTYEGINGRTFNIIPSCSTGNKLLTVNHFSAKNGFILGPDGESIKLDIFQKEFALISPHDYFSEKPNFQSLTPFLE